MIKGFRKKKFLLLKTILQYRPEGLSWLSKDYWNLNG